MPTSAESRIQNAERQPDADPDQEHDAEAGEGSGDIEQACGSKPRRLRQSLPHMAVAAPGTKHESDCTKEQGAVREAIHDRWPGIHAAQTKSPNVLRLAMAARAS